MIRRLKWFLRKYAHFHNILSQQVMGPKTFHFSKLVSLDCIYFNGIEMCRRDNYKKIEEENYLLFKIVREFSCTNSKK